MKEGNVSSSRSATWDGLEDKVDALIDLNWRLAEENKALRRQQREWFAERAVLVNKIEATQSRLETMIMRYKSLERD